MAPTSPWPEASDTVYYENFDRRQSCMTGYLGIPYATYSNIHIFDKIVRRMNNEQPAGDIDTPHGLLVMSASKYFAHRCSLCDGGGKLDLEDFPGPFLDMLHDPKQGKVALDYLLQMSNLFDGAIIRAVLDLHNNTNDETVKLLCIEYILESFFMSPQVDEARRLARVVFENECQILFQMIDDPLFKDYESDRKFLSTRLDLYNRCKRGLSVLREKHLGDKIDGVDSSPFQESGSADVEDRGLP